MIECCLASFKSNPIPNANPIPITFTNPTSITKPIPTKGSAVWTLLKRLCDAALEQSIRSLILTNQTESTVAKTLRQSASLWATLASPG
jgi:hypothetical protein